MVAVAAVVAVVVAVVVVVVAVAVVALPVVAVVAAQVEGFLHKLLPRGPASQKDTQPADSEKRKS